VRARSRAGNGGADFDTGLPLHRLSEAERQRLFTDRMFPAAAFEAVSGETQIGALHGETPYQFCGHCLNWIFTAPAAPFVMAGPAMFDAPDWATPFVETDVSEKLDWAATPAQHSFASFPAEDQYGPILAAYAVWAGAHEGQG
jgi:hypothetical protein